MRFFAVSCSLREMERHSNEPAARPDFAELDVFLGQHILLTLEQHFNSKI